MSSTLARPRLCRDPSDHRRYFAELSYSQALAVCPSLEDTKARLNRLWAHRSDAPAAIAEWRNALSGLICCETLPVLKHIAGDRKRLIDWIRFADYQSEHPLPAWVPDRFSIYRGFNFRKGRQQNGIYWTPDISIAWGATGWESDVGEFPDTSRATDELPEQGVVHTVVERDDVLWWLDSGQCSGFLYDIFEVAVDIRPRHLRRMLQSEIEAVAAETAKITALWK
jgi:hypothetical protein